MPKDAKLEEIELVRDDINTEDQEIVAKRLQEEWPANFKDLEKEFGDYSRSTYQKVYNEYFGDPDDPKDRTVEQLRMEFDSIKKYKEEKKHGALDLDEEDGNISKREHELYQEGFKEGIKWAKENL